MKDINELNIIDVFGSFYVCSKGQEPLDKKGVYKKVDDLFIEIYPCEYDYIFNIVNNFLVLMNDSGTFIFNIDNGLCTEEFEDVVYVDGYFKVRKHGLYSLLTLELEHITPFEYEGINVLNKDLILVYKKGMYNLIDSKGIYLFEHFCDCIEVYNNYLIVTKDGKKGVCDLEGNILIDCVNEDIISYKDKYLFVKYDCYYNVIDVKKYSIVVSDVSYIKYVSDEFIILSRCGFEFLLDDNCNFILGGFHSIELGDYIVTELNGTCVKYSYSVKNCIIN